MLAFPATEKVSWKPEGLSSFRLLGNPARSVRRDCGCRLFRHTGAAAARHLLRRSRPGRRSTSRDRRSWLILPPKRDTEAVWRTYRCRLPMEARQSPRVMRWLSRSRPCEAGQSRSTAPSRHAWSRGAWRWCPHRHVAGSRHPGHRGRLHRRSPSRHSVRRVGAILRGQNDQPCHLRGPQPDPAIAL